MLRVLLSGHHHPNKMDLAWSRHGQGLPKKACLTGREIECDGVFWLSKKQRLKRTLPVASECPGGSWGGREG